MATEKPTPTKKQGLLDLLPDGFAKLPVMQYRRRPARNSSEFLSEVEFDVDSPAEAARRFQEKQSKG